MQTEQQGIVAFFYGVEQRGICGASMMIKINKSLNYRLKMSIGPGSNTKVELLVLWGLLYFAKTKNILPVKIFGDSKVIVDWAKGFHDLHIIQLNHWIRRTKELIDFFKHSSFSHIY